MPEKTETPETPEKLTHSEQSRLNGSKSRGPKTAEGKAKSSSNALVHGFAAVINVVLVGEDKAAFELHVEKTRAAYKPIDYAEESFVDQLAGIQWRQSRLVGLETALIDAQMGIQDPVFHTLYPDGSENEYFRLVKAWQALSHQPPKPKPVDEATNQPRQYPGTPPEIYDITSIELVRRYQVSLDRQFRNTLLNLRQYRKDFAAAPNEPETPPQPQQPPPERTQPEAIAPPKPAPVYPQTILPTAPEPPQIHLVTEIRKL